MCTPCDFAWALFIISYKWYYCAYCNTAYATEVINHLYVFVIKMAHIQHTHVKLIPVYILCCAIVSYRMSFNYLIRLWTLIWAFLRYENLNLVLWFVTLRISVGGHQGFRRINCLQLLGRSWRQLLTTHKSVLYCVTTYNPKSIYIVSFLFKNTVTADSRFSLILHLTALLCQMVTCMAPYRPATADLNVRGTLLVLLLSPVKCMASF